MLNSKYAILERRLYVSFRYL